jgi:hypothetical protein
VAFGAQSIVGAAQAHKAYETPRMITRL